MAAQGKPTLAIFDAGDVAAYYGENGVATPARPATGPAGQHCRGCRHKVVVRSSFAGFQGAARTKCRMMIDNWRDNVDSPRTDIKVCWDACEWWEPGGHVGREIFQALERSLGVYRRLCEKDMSHWEPDLWAALADQIEELEGPDRAILEPFRFVLMRWIGRWEEQNEKRAVLMRSLRGRRIDP